MAYFPFMVDIEHWNCLVVGGGKVALHKTELLLPFGVRIKVVAKEFCPKKAQAGSRQLSGADSTSLRRQRY
jgi:siroheme synthase (precorrin-2 oxidase/ferrochelatase)